MLIECISWLINVTDSNDARWKPELNVRLAATKIFYSVATF